MSNSRLKRSIDPLPGRGDQAIPNPPPPTAAALLEAATQVFFELGFWRAGVREIATRAGVNVAAVSYHFGGKQELYLAVLSRLASAGIRRYPLPGRDPGQTRDERLEAAVLALLSRFMGSAPVALLPQFMVRELAEPSTALPALIEQVLQPQLHQFESVVQEFLPAGLAPEELRRCTLSVVGQCLFYLFARPAIPQISALSYEDDVAVAALARHIARFSAAGLREMAI